MKNFIKLFVTIGIVAIAVACNRDECDFDGGDNYITGFDLTVGGITYQGAVTEDQIILSVPEGLSLRGAVAEVRISENASISPDPSQIEDWASEEQFVVTAYNNQRKSYIYRLNRTSVSTSGNVVLSTQEEVDAFAATGISVIDGNLTIGKTSGSTAADSIRNLSGLSALKQVVYNITVNNTYAGENLEGLAGLEKIGGMSVGTVASLTDIYFPKLTAIGTNLSIGSTTLQRLRMPELAFVGEGFSVKSDALTSADFGELAEVGGSMVFNGTNGSSQKNTMETVSFPKLETVGGTLTMSYWAAANKMDLPLLKTVGGMMTLAYWNKLDAMKFPALESAGGLTLNNSSALSDLVMPALKTMQGNMALSTLNSMQSLFIDALTQVDGGITLTLGAATGVSFASLESVGGTLNIPSGASNLAMPYFPKLKSVGGDLQIQTPAMTDLAGFPALEQIGARLYLYNATGITTIDDLVSLKKVGTSIYLYGMAALAELDVRGIETPQISLYLSTYAGLKITGDDVFAGKLDFGSTVSGETDFPKISGFKTVGEITIGVSGNYRGGTIDLPGIREVTGTLTVSFCNYLRVLNMPDLKKVGNITFTSSNFGMQRIDMPSLEEIVGDFTYPTSYSSSYGGPLSDINMPALKKIGGNFSVTNLAAANTLTGLNMPLIESVGGTLTITGTSNPNFTDVSNFSNLVTVGGGVTISNFTNLTSFAGFKNALASFDGNKWKISGCGYNPTYQNMIDGAYTLP